MRTLPLSLYLCLFVLFVSCKQEKEKTETDPGMSIGMLHISKAEPKQGDSLLISYSPLTAIPEKEQLDAYYTYFVGSKNYPVDIELKESNGMYTGSLRVPDSANAMVYHFKTGYTFEANDKKGYQHIVYDTLRNPVIGGDMSLANFHMYMGENYGIKADKKDIFAIMRSAIEKHPELLNMWDQTYGNILMGEDEENGKNFLNKRIEHYSAKTALTDTEYAKLTNFFKNLQMETKVDSITKLALSAFPKGEVAARTIIDQFFQESDAKNQKKIYDDYIKDFGKEGRFANFMANNLVYKAVSIKDFETIKSLTKDVHNNLQNAGLLNNIAWNMAEADKNLELAEDLSKKSLDILKALEGNDIEKPDYFSHKQFAKEIKSNYLMNVDTYAYILFKRGKKEEALKYQIEAIGEDKIGIPEVNERYVQFLIANNKDLEALTEASRFIRMNQGTPKMKQYLRQAFTANKDMKGDFNDYIENLESEAKTEAYVNLKKKMIDDEAFDFSLKNLKGEEVTLSNLKGKTVILDFWATWCGPCKDSFPGMQEAVNKYKDDAGVMFLFVDTLENGTPEEIEKNVRAFITENNYSFNVLLDQPVKEGSRNYVVTDGYSIKGIPTKIIIGPDGRVKFKSVGYRGSTEQLVEELDLMIDLLKT